LPRWQAERSIKQRQCFARPPYFKTVNELAALQQLLVIFISTVALSLSGKRLLSHGALRDFVSSWQRRIGLRPRAADGPAQQSVDPFLRDHQARLRVIEQTMLEIERARLSQDPAISEVIKRAGRVESADRDEQRESATEARQRALEALDRVHAALFSIGAPPPDDDLQLQSGEQIRRRLEELRDRQRNIAQLSEALTWLRLYSLRYADAATDEVLSKQGASLAHSAGEAAVPTQRLDKPR
jgi:hypothetical protein